MIRHRCASGPTCGARARGSTSFASGSTAGYERQLDLPAGYGGGIEATLHNGQLAIRVLRGAPNERIDFTLT